MSKPTNNTNNKEERLTFRLTPDQKARLRKVAARLNKKPAEMVRDVVLLEIARMDNAA